MYESFYGLSSKPFQLNPDPSFYFGSKQHQRASAYLEYGLHQNEGFIVVTGEVGAGKTTIVRGLLNKLDPEKVVAAHLVSTQLDAEETLRMVAAAFGIRTKNLGKSDILLALEAFLVEVTRQGKRCLLIVDEAQNLTPRAVEELRMLSNFQLDTHALLQSFLIGQPEFRSIMQSPHMLQLRQRVIAACHIGPMDKSETRGYIEHRLKCAGSKGWPKFEAGAFEAIFLASNGIPRRINSLADRILLSGFLSGNRTFTREQVQEVANELNAETQSSAYSLSTEPAPGSLTDIGAQLAEGSALESELARLELDINGAIEASRANSDLKADQTEQRLMRVERSMMRLERHMIHLERGNAAMLSLLQQLANTARVEQSDEEKLV
ncbi:XrtA/PEP-CTERM system-associated ATPase [Chitinimonas naiadis]